MVGVSTWQGPGAAVGRRNMSQAVAAELLRRIAEGQYPPGTRAPTERELMEMFAVGRSTAREAMSALVAGGLLDVRPGRGPVVLRLPDEALHALDPQSLSALLTDQSLAQLYEFRLLVETECAASAALRATPEDVAIVRDLLRQFRDAVSRESTTHELDLHFHLAIARASHNEVFVDVLEAVSSRLREARATTDSVAGAREIAVLGHTEIYEAVAAHNAEGARAAMRAHVLSGLAALEDAHGINAHWPGRAEGEM
jgi:DNA-binding FadR family transcriptional regulator